MMSQSLWIFLMISILPSTLTLPLQEISEPNRLQQIIGIDKCIRFDLAQVEELKIAIQHKVNIFQFGIRRISFGLLDEDWARLELLQCRLPQDSILKSKLFNSFQILMAALYEAHLNSNINKHREQHATGDVLLKPFSQNRESTNTFGERDSTSEINTIYPVSFNKKPLVEPSASSIKKESGSIKFFSVKTDQICNDIDLRQIERLKLTIQNEVNAFQFEIRERISFGLLDEDWLRLELLECRLPQDSILKSKLFIAFRMLIAALYEAHLKPSIKERTEQNTADVLLKFSGPNRVNIAAHKDGDSTLDNKTVNYNIYPVSVYKIPIIEPPARSSTKEVVSVKPFPDEPDQQPEESNQYETALPYPTSPPAPTIETKPFNLTVYPSGTKNQNTEDSNIFNSPDTSFPVVNEPFSTTINIKINNEIDEITGQDFHRSTVEIITPNPGRSKQPSIPDSNNKLISSNTDMAEINTESSEVYRSSTEILNNVTINTPIVTTERKQYDIFSIYDTSSIDRNKEYESSLNTPLEVAPTIIDIFKGKNYNKSRTYSTPISETTDGTTSNIFYLNGSTRYFIPNQEPTTIYNTNFIKTDKNSEEENLETINSIEYEDKVTTNIYFNIDIEGQTNISSQEPTKKYHSDNVLNKTKESEYVNENITSSGDTTIQGIFIINFVNGTMEETKRTNLPYSAETTLTNGKESSDSVTEVTLSEEKDKTSQSIEDPIKQGNTISFDNNNIYGEKHNISPINADTTGGNEKEGFSFVTGKPLSEEKYDTSPFNEDHEKQENIISVDTNNLEGGKHTSPFINTESDEGSGKESSNIVTVTTLSEEKDHTSPSTEYPKKPGNIIRFDPNNLESGKNTSPFINTESEEGNEKENSNIITVKTLSEEKDHTSPSTEYPRKPGNIIRFDPNNLESGKHTSPFINTESDEGSGKESSNIVTVKTLSEEKDHTSPSTEYPKKPGNIIRFDPNNLESGKNTSPFINTESEEENETESSNIVTVKILSEENDKSTPTAEDPKKQGNFIVSVSTNNMGRGIFTTLPISEGTTGSNGTEISNLVTGPTLGEEKGKAIPSTEYSTKQSIFIKGFATSAMEEGTNTIYPFSTATSGTNGKVSSTLSEEKDGIITTRRPFTGKSNTTSNLTTDIAEENESPTAENSILNTVTLSTTIENKRDTLPSSEISINSINANSEDEKNSFAQTLVGIVTDQIIDITPSIDMYREEDNSNNQETTESKEIKMNKIFNPNSDVGINSSRTSFAPVLSVSSTPLNDNDNDESSLIEIIYGKGNTPEEEKTDDANFNTDTTGCNEKSSSTTDASEPNENKGKGDSTIHKGKVVCHTVYETISTEYHPKPTESFTIFNVDIPHREERSTSTSHINKLDIIPNYQPYPPLNKMPCKNNECVSGTDVGYWRPPLPTRSPKSSSRGSPTRLKKLQGSYLPWRVLTQWDPETKRWWYKIRSLGSPTKW